MSCTSIRRRSGLSSKTMRHEPTRRRNNPWCSPLSALTSPEKGSSLIRFSAVLIRCRSRAGIERKDRSAALASRKSQVTLQVFKPDEIATLELRASALDGLHLVRLGVG
jgi:hypothetical protein